MVGFPTVFSYVARAIRLAADSVPRPQVDGPSALSRPRVGAEDPDELRLMRQLVERLGGSSVRRRVGIEVDPEDVLPARATVRPRPRLEAGKGEGPRPARAQGPMKGGGGVPHGGHEGGP